MGICDICLACINGVQERHISVNSNQAAEEGVRCYHHRTANSLLAAVRAKCRLCFGFWDLFSTEHQAAIQRLTDKWCMNRGWTEPFMLCVVDNPVTSVDRPNTEKIRQIRVSFILRFGQEVGRALAGVDGEALRFSTKTYLFVPSFSYANDRFGHPTSSSTASEESWLTVSTWLRDCESMHAACNVTEEPNWYPTRLIKICRTADGNDVVRLTFSAIERPSERYVTLSHCWGQVRPLTLRKDNLGALQAGIAFSTLPLTFQHAIIVTRKLRIQFLWIDSLCILQDHDDLSDWLRESLLMEKVYSNAYCNVAATASFDGTQGLFRTRDPDMLQRIEFDASFVQYEGHIQVVKYTALPLNYWDDTVGHLPLSRRAWALQEAFLAKRVIHFGDHQIFFECRKRQASEDLPGGFLEEMRVNNWKDTNTFAPVPRTLSDGSQSVGHIYTLWSKIQTFYSKSQLSQPADKLIAISGIAKKFQRLTGDQYIAGMWRRYLPSQMLWQVDNKWVIKPLKHRAALAMPYRAPSFSWAAVDAPTQIAAHTQPNLLFHVSNIQIDSANGDDTGLLRSCSLCLHGTLKSITFEQVIAKAAPQLGHKWAPIIDCRRMQNSKYETPNVYLDEPSRDLSTSKHGFFYCPARELYMKGTKSSCDVLICILFELIDAEEGKYCRIGIMDTTPLGTMDAAHIEWVKFLIAPRQDESEVPCLSYAAGSKRPHTILLI